MRRTKFQRREHRRVIEEGLVAGLAPAQVVRAMVKNYGLTCRQARHDLDQVQAEFRRQDDEIRQDRWKLADLALASDRCDREFRAALEAGDARRALRVEKHRSKLLGIYHADRRRSTHTPLKVRLARIAKINADFDAMYAEAPRNPDGSVVLTAFSLNPPRPDDERYRRRIEEPLARGPSPRRRERIDAMRAALAAGARKDQLETVVRQEYGISSRQVRADVRTLEAELEADGYAMHQGGHDVQLLPLALRRRERIAQLALHPQCSHLAPRDEQPAGRDQAASAAAGSPNACGSATNETLPTSRSNDDRRPPSAGEGRGRSARGRVARPEHGGEGRGNATGHGHTTPIASML
jgi:hypothetical protein